MIGGNRNKMKDNIYCDTCISHDDNKRCEDCHMNWQPSDKFLDQIKKVILAVPKDLNIDEEQAV